MDVKRILAVTAGKAIIYISRLLGNQGSDFPGRVALKIDPRLLSKLSGQIKRHTIIVTGTNGKTTTSNMIAAILTAAGYSLVHNKAGANMVSGITTAFIQAAGMDGNCARDCALLETDEANVPLLMRQLRPDYMVITNFFRDQLDRYGELDRTIALIRDSVKQQPLCLLLNGDDPLQSHFADCANWRCYGFGPTDYDTAAATDSREGRFCVRCGAELNYARFHYAHLGAYACPGCGSHNPEPAYRGTELSMGGAGISLNINGQAYKSPYQGFYNAYNLLAAAALGQELQIAGAVITAAIAQYQPRAGRLEKFSVAGCEATLVLVKNPTGLDQSLNGLKHDPRGKALFFALNDNAADGRDVSWVWDAELEMIAEPEAAVGEFIASGLRSGDIALRALYAGFAREKIRIESDLKAGIAAAINCAPADCVYIFSTYTALFDCQRILRRLARKYPAPGPGRPREEVS